MTTHERLCETLIECDVLHKKNQRLEKVAKRYAVLRTHFCNPDGLEDMLNIFRGAGLEDRWPTPVEFDKLIDAAVEKNHDQKI